MRQLPTIRCDGTIWDALAVIDAGAAEIAFVVDGSGKVVGTVTDGDVRRALLRGLTLGSSIVEIVNRKFVAVGPEAGRAEVLDLMRARTLSQIPVLDAAGRLAAMHLLREIVGAAERPNWAVVMAGGRGERLRPLTDSLPKPMVQVAGRPILERIVLHLVGFGIRRIFLAVNYMSEVIEAHFGDGRELGCALEYLREARPLGTGGALSLLPELPKHPLLVMNGDLVTQFDAGRMLGRHEETGSKITIGVHEYAHRVPYGVVEIEADRIVSLSEKPTMTWLANAGIYVLEPEIVKRVPDDCSFPLPSLVESCLDRGEPVGYFPIEDAWADIGRPLELLAATGERGDR